MNKILPKQLLKSRLQTLRSKEFDLEKEDSVTDYIESMLQNIGTVDSELRDDLIYSAFAKWITDGRISADDMLHIKNTILDRYISDLE
ncbi:hypothetical protein [Paenibacillus bovis]|uniref:Uncharacterized protein n=1 Tax=Paenibacillus bovis TaxID=1616788 RepID=A0A172ZJI3_9BACL|nr:hypothetical protein [Paenibacillus bovis]ANF97699.1 hypothetical protein AR543_17920 [Paenibacillus bovis]